MNEETNTCPFRNALYDFTCNPGNIGIVLNYVIDSTKNKSDK